MTDRKLLLLQNTDGPLLLACPCGSALVGGEYIVAEVIRGARFGLCDACAGRAAPELASCVEALNVLGVMAPGLSPEHSTRLLCALVDQLARLAGPTIALLNVNPNLIERINKP